MEFRRNLQAGQVSRLPRVRTDGRKTHSFHFGEFRARAGSVRAGDGSWAFLAEMRWKGTTVGIRVELARQADPRVVGGALRGCGGRAIRDGFDAAAA